MKAKNMMWVVDSRLSSTCTIFLHILMSTHLVCTTPIIPIKPHYNLQSDDRYLKYLPARVSELNKIINKSGLESALEYIRNDRDYESYLFILSAKEPFTLCAYSRTKQFFGKTAIELQKILFPTYETGSERDVAVIFNQWISTAHKGDTFIPYRWRLSAISSEITQVAYVSKIHINAHTYIIGATVSTPFVPNHIILPHRSQTILKRYKNNNIAGLFSYINNDLVKYLYFFAGTIDPMREIANGQNPGAIGQTPEMQQEDVFPDCKDESCDMMLVFKKAIYQAKRGGGFICYLWHSFINEPVAMKVAYIHPFLFKKSKLYIGSGYTPFNFPEHLKTELPQSVENVLKLIKEIGLENTASKQRKENNKKLYLFIIEQNIPYTSYLDLVPALETSAQEATVNAKKIDPTCAINYTQFRGDMVHFIQHFSGWYAYEYKTPDPTIPSMLKIAYIKPFKYNGKKYVVGATYQTLA